MGTGIGFELSGISFGENFPEVIASARAGEEWGWTVLYRAVAGPVTGFLRGRGASDPIDLAGDVFFELARSITKFEGDESDFRTYVFSTAHRKLAEAMESHTPHRSVLADDVLGKLRGDNFVVDLKADELITENVRTAFAALNPEQRDVLSLRILGGLTLRETATVVDRGIGQVRSIQRRALTKIRNLPAVAEALT